MGDKPVYSGDEERRALLKREPTLVFNWVAGHRYDYGLTTEEVAERFAPDDWQAAHKWARKNYHASAAFRRNRRRRVVQFIDVD